LTAPLLAKVMLILLVAVTTLAVLLVITLGVAETVCVLPPMAVPLIFMVATSDPESACVAVSVTVNVWGALNIMVYVDPTPVVPCRDHVNPVVLEAADPVYPTLPVYPLPADPVYPTPPVNGDPLMYRPVLSTRMRSQVPAPISTVHVQPAAAGKLPITVLLTPVVNAHPAQYPMATLPPVALAD